MPASPDSPEAVEILDALDRDQKRFLREIRMTARLELAGVPAVYDTGVDGPSDAIRLLEAGLRRAVPGSVIELQIRRMLAAALLIGGQYSRAAQLFEQAGKAYRQYLGAADPWALDCAYQAGHAYAQAGKPDKALPQLRYYVMNAVSLAARNADEAAKVMESRFVIAQLLASIGEAESAIAELRAVRPLLATAYAPESAQVRNLDKQAARLQSVPGKML